MFDVGWSEMVVIGVVALVVIGPKELPGVIRSVGRAVGKLRTMAGDFRAQFDDAMREADLHEVKKTFTEAADAANSAANSISDPLGSVQTELKSALDGAKDEAAGATGASEATGTLAQIEADIRSMETDAAGKPAEPGKPAGSAA